jgi:hypothetical protein
MRNFANLVRVLPHWLTTQSQSVSFDDPEVRLCSARRLRRSTSSSVHAPDAPAGLLEAMVNVGAAVVDVDEMNWVVGGAEVDVVGCTGADWVGMPG